MKRIVAKIGAVCCCGCILPLVGCTEVRDRQYAKTVAVTHHAANAEPAAWEAALCSHPATVHPAVTAEAYPLLPARLLAQTGPTLYMGHLSLLMVSGETLCDVNGQSLLTWGLQTQWLPPDCGVLDTGTASACDVLAESPALEFSAALDAAVAGGTLPPRLAADCVGDFWGGSGVTVLPYLAELIDAETPVLSLSVRDANHLLGVLSASACQGLALLADDWTTCVLPVSYTQADGRQLCATANLRACQAWVSVRQASDALELRIHAHWDAPMPRDSAWTAEYWAAACTTAINDCLTAALQETAVQYGADCCLLRESALQNGVADASGSPAEWRAALMEAEVTIANSSPNRSVSRGR